MTVDEADQFERFLSIKEVKVLVSLSAAEIYRRIAAGRFPKPFRLGANRVAWTSTEIKAWQRKILAAPEASPASDSSESVTVMRQVHKPGRFLRLAEVLHQTGIGKTEVYAQIKRGTFPRQVRLTRTRVAWSESEINAWMQKKIDARPLQFESPVPIIRNSRPEIVPPRSATKEPTMNTTTRTRKTQNARPMLSDDWAAQNAEGRQLARALLLKLRKNQAPFMLERELSRMIEDETPRGVIVGFLHIVGEAAMRGAYLQ